MLQEDELANALKNAKKDGVKEMISCSTSFASNKKNLLLAKEHLQIKPALGLYPLDILELSQEELDKAFDFFEAQISSAIAIGEVGLDYKFAKSEEEQKKQEEIFFRFIELAKKYGKPLIIHSRYAQTQVLEALQKATAKKVLLHSFVDSAKLMKTAAELGYFVSAGLSLLYKKDAQENIKTFPLEKLLFETDSPIRFNGEKAFPKNIKQIAEKVAEIKSISVKEVEAQQEKNYLKLFGK